MLTPPTRIVWKAPTAPKTLLFLKAGEVEIPRRSILHPQALSRKQPKTVKQERFAK